MSRFSNSNNYPLDWKCFRFDQLFNFEGGLSISRENLSDEGICYLHYGDIHTSTENYIDVKKDYDKLPKYNEKLQNINQKYLLNDGDIVIADASEDYEGIGKAVVIFNEENIPFISGLHTIVAKDKTDLIYRDFKRYFLSDWYIRKQMMFYATGISVFGLSKENVKKIQVILPSKLEQQKIADILSTWDKAIELKEKLIEQKKEQKKGLMQRLLTGKVRLPGFKGEWKEVRLKQILEVRNEKSEITEDLELYSLTIEEGVTPKTDRYNREFLVKDDNKQYKITYKDDIVYNPSNLRFGAIAINKIQKPVLLSPIYEVLFIKDTSKYDVSFIAQLLTSDRQIRIFSTMAEGTLIERKAVKVDAFLNTAIYIPQDIKEQKAISKIIGCYERGIELLQQELEALKQQKKGLMQLLLTGKVRVKC